MSSHRAILFLFSVSIGPRTHIYSSFLQQPKKKRLPAARVYFTLRRFCTVLIIISSRFCTFANYFSTVSPVLLI